MKRITRQVIWPFFFIIAAVFLLYLPILINFSLLLNRGNDLKEQFWPAFYYIKQNFLLHHEFPLWNTMWFAGMPLLPDPQFSIFYPPHILFVFLPINVAFLVSMFLHTILGATGMYVLARRGFSFCRSASIVATFIYTLNPKLAGYLEAGHPGLVDSMGWIPWATFAVIQLIKNPGVKWSVLLAISLAGIFYLHTVTFAIAVVATAITLVIGIYATRFQYHSIVFVVFAYLLTLGLTAITLLPQLNWMPYTTRFLLLQNPDVYPKWESIREFFFAVLIPWSQGLENSWDIDSEKWLTLGITPTLLALAGFWHLPKKLKIVLFLTCSTLLVITLNNGSPFYQLLIQQGWYALLRVSTRVWFIIIVITAVLAGYGFTKLQKKYNILIQLIVILFIIVESIVISWIRIYKPIPQQSKFVSSEVYTFLKNDSEQFRVFCTNRCISQKEAVQSGIELIEGYNTLQQKNYYNEFIQLSQQYWDRYTLALPPFEIYHFQKIQPYAHELADYNVKYVIAPYPLKDQGLKPLKQFGDYTVFLNTIYKSRAYFSDGTPAPITHYSPNLIRVDVTQHISDELILAEVYSSGWHAYLDGNEEISIQETKNALRQVRFTHDSSFIEFKYEPLSYQIGKLISGVTILFLLFITLTSQKKLRKVLNLTTLYKRKKY